MLQTLRSHWPNYLIEAVGLGILMIVMGCMATLLYAPLSPISKGLGNDFWRGVCMGMALGSSWIALIYSPWGKRSGAHLNPAITLTYWRLNKLSAPDALGYILAQFIGSWVGVSIVAMVVGEPFTQHLHYGATTPQAWGWFGAFTIEALVAFVFMLTVLLASNALQLASYTGWYAGGLIFVFAIFATPISGFGMNPARSFAAGVSAQLWDSFWIYYFVPCGAMLVAAEVYGQVMGRRSSICCKLCPNDEHPCISSNCCRQPQQRP